MESSYCNQLDVKLGFLWCLLSLSYVAEILVLIWFNIELTSIFEWNIFRKLAIAQSFATCVFWLKGGLHVQSKVSTWVARYFWAYIIKRFPPTLTKWDMLLLLTPPNIWKTESISITEYNILFQIWVQMYLYWFDIEAYMAEVFESV